MEVQFGTVDEHSPTLPNINSIHGPNVIGSKATHLNRPDHSGEKTRKSKLAGYYIALSIFFRQIGKLLGYGVAPKQIFYGSNLDPFYLGALIFILRKKQKNKHFTLFLSISAIVAMYALAQIAVGGNLDTFQIAMNVAKISICIALVFFAIENQGRVDFVSTIRIITSLYIIGITCAVVLRNNELFWRFNDYINGYNETRLTLLYLEPSEFGFHCVVVIIFSLGFLLNATSLKDRCKHAVPIFVCGTGLTLAMPLGAILVGSLAVVILIIHNAGVKSGIRALVTIILILILITTVIYVMAKTNNPIYLRILDTFDGTDRSNYYRIGVTIEFCLSGLRDTHGLGLGFGNSRTSEVLWAYSSIGVTSAMPASFPTYIVEGGVFAIVSLLALLGVLLKGCLVGGRSSIKWALFVLTIGYQVFAGHFTSGLHWILYGLILSDFDETRIANEGQMIGEKKWLV